MEGGRTPAKSGPKVAASGNRREQESTSGTAKVGTKWKQDSKRRTREATKWEVPLQCETRKATKWDQSGAKWEEESKSGTRRPVDSTQSGHPKLALESLYFTHIHHPYHVISHPRLQVDILS